MGLIRKSLSLSTAGAVNWRNKSERAAAAERKKARGYNERTRIDKELREAELAMKQRELELREREIALQEREAQQ